MNPYFAPFVMPDGSLRRPIVERVPECRPKRAPFWILREVTADCAWCWDDKRGLERDPVPLQMVACHTEDAIALCRAACEDWLLSHCGTLLIDHGTYPKPSYTAEMQSVRLGTRFESHEMIRASGQFDDPSDVHGALLLVAHAIADKEGRP